MDEPDDLHELERALLDGIRATLPAPEPHHAGPEFLTSLFVAQVQSRVLDHTARWLRGSGKGYYTSQPARSNGRWSEARSSANGASSCGFGAPGARSASVRPNHAANLKP